MTRTEILNAVAEGSKLPLTSSLPLWYGSRRWVGQLSRGGASMKLLLLSLGVLTLNFLDLFWWIR